VLRLGTPIAVQRLHHVKRALHKCKLLVFAADASRAQHPHTTAAVGRWVNKHGVGKLGFCHSHRRAARSTLSTSPNNDDCDDHNDQSKRDYSDNDLHPREFLWHPPPTAAVALPSVVEKNRCWRWRFCWGRRGRCSMTLKRANRVDTHLPRRARSADGALVDVDAWQ
jgi:hypothetical protein